jgi:hypothetical protein
LPPSIDSSVPLNSTILSSLNIWNVGYCLKIEADVSTSVSFVPYLLSKFLSRQLVKGACTLSISRVSLLFSPQSAQDKPFDKLRSPPIGQTQIPPLNRIY